MTRASVTALCLLFALLSPFRSSHAEGRIEVSYHAGESESALSARAGAMAKLRLAALPHIGQLLRSHSRLQDGELSERVDQLAEAAIRLRDVSEQWVSEGPDRVLRLSAWVEVDQGAIDRFLESAPGSGPTTLPLDEPLLAAKQRQLEAIEHREALMQPWVDRILRPLLSTPVEVELLELEIPPDGRDAMARLRVRWQLPSSALASLCERISCIHRVSGDRIMLAGFVNSAPSDPVSLSTADAQRLTRWFHDASLRVFVLLGSSRFLVDVPVLVNTDDPYSLPRRGQPPRWMQSGVQKELYTMHEAELRVRIPVDSLESTPIITASIGLDERV